MRSTIIFANNRKDIQYPPTLQEAIKGMDAGDKLLTNPRQPDEKVGYIYVPPAGGAPARERGR